MAMTRLLNDGSTEAPKLRLFLNLDNLTDLRADSVWPGLTGDARDERLLADGFDGIQLTTDEAYAGRMQYCGLNRISTPAEADAVAAKHSSRGDLCLTVHAGWGIEDDGEVARLVEAIVNASDRYRLPIFIETHRATITQDLWRTVQIAKRFPEVRFNGDFSHYYCGQELIHSSNSAGENPARSDEVAGVSVRNALQVVLMLRLRLPEFSRRHNFRYCFTGPQSRGIDVSNGFFSNALLLVAGIENCGAITVAKIISLAISCCWIVDLEEELQDLAVRDFQRVEDDLDCFGMTRMVPIRGVRDVAACIADPSGNYAWIVAQQILHSPEATTGKNCSFVGWRHRFSSSFFSNRSQIARALFA
jgi:hypothetical protein